MASTCKNCEAPADLTICWTCAKTLRRHLIGDTDEVGLPWLIARLHESAYGEAKIGRISQRVGGQGETPGLPLNMYAARILREITGQINMWIGLATVPPDFIGPLPAGVWRAGRDGVVTDLARNIPAIMARGDAHGILRRLAAMRAEAMRAIDLPPDMRYVGPCPATFAEGKSKGERCAVGLYVERGDTVAICPRCKTPHDVEDMQAAALAKVDDEPRTAADMLRLLKYLGREVSKSTFYKHIGPVQPRVYLHTDGRRNQRHEDKASALYAYSDIVAALDAADEREQAAKDKRRNRRKGAA